MTSDQSKHGGQQFSSVFSGMHDVMIVLSCKTFRIPPHININITGSQLDFWVKIGFQTIHMTCVYVT